MLVESLSGSRLGGLKDDFVIVQWTAEVGDHWIAPLHVHHEDDEAWRFTSQVRMWVRCSLLTHPSF